MASRIQYTSNDQEAAKHRIEYIFKIDLFDLHYTLSVMNNSFFYRCDIDIIAVS